MDGTRTPSLTDLVARTRGLQPWRRVFHATSGVALALAPELTGLATPQVAALLGLATAILLAADIVRLRSPRLNRAFFSVFRPLASPREESAIASSTWYALGAALVWWAAPGAPAVLALLVLGLADPAASVVGRRFGRTPFGKGTALGSLTFFIVAFAVVASDQPVGTAFVVATVAALAEVLPIPVDDNLTVPLATAACLWSLTAQPFG